MFKRVKSGTNLAKDCFLMYKHIGQALDKHVASMEQAWGNDTQVCAVLIHRVM